jgi:cysteinyl-tRNA synthetase
LIDVTLQIRNIAKSNKHGEYLKVCDDFRNDKMVNLGVRLEDTQEGSVWKLVDAQELKEEIEKKAQEADQKKKDKLASTLAARKKDLDAIKKKLMPPLTVFDDEKDQYSKFSPEGLPTHDKDGVELAKGALKKVQTKFNKQQKAYEDGMKKLEQDPGLVERLEKEIAELEAQLK